MSCGCFRQPAIFAARKRVSTIISVDSLTVDRMRDIRVDLSLIVSGSRRINALAIQRAQSPTCSQLFQSVFEPKADETDQKHLSERRRTPFHLAHCARVRTLP